MKLGLSLGLSGQQHSGPSAFTPAQLALSGWWRASYAGSPWAGTASGGASGGRNVSEATNPPSVGPLQNGFAAALFDGTNDQLRTAITVDNFVSNGAGSIWALFLAVSAGADSGAGSRFNNKGIVANDGGGTMMNLTFSTAGVSALLFSSGWKDVTLACGTGAYHLAQMRWNGTLLGLRIDSGAWSTVACAATSFSGGAVVLGRNFGTAFQNMGLLDVGTAQSTFDDATFDDIKSYCNTQYALAL